METMENEIDICMKLLDILHDDIKYSGYRGKRMYFSIYWFSQYLRQYVEDHKTKNRTYHNNIQHIRVLRNEIKYELHLLKELHFPLKEYADFLYNINELLKFMDCFLVMEALTQ